MGDDAEYYIEQQEEEASFKQACDYAALECNRKSVLCWADRYADEIWSWEPLSRVLGVFSNLYNVRQVGIDYFLASSIPVDEDTNNEYTSSSKPDDLSEIKLIEELEFYVANSEVEATHEVIVLSRQDTAQLKEEAVRLKSSANTLKEVMLYEMLEEMISYIEAHLQKNRFVFAREL